MAKAQVRFELNYDGIGQLLQSPEMEAALLEMSAHIEGDRKVWHSSGRTARASVQIYRDNEDNSLLKSLFGGGDRHDS
jgi:hypothetical protein